ncbi:zinc-ribbon domain containing protein, partial [Haloferula luteola]
QGWGCCDSKRVPSSQTKAHNSRATAVLILLWYMPRQLNLGGSYFRPTYFDDLPFVCQDCGEQQVWKAEDQAWYYEASGAPYYSTAIRCRSCRAAEKKRKLEARRAAGHE